MQRSASGDVVKALGENRQEGIQARKRNWVADNDDGLPNEILAIIDGIARAAARRDHFAAKKGTIERD